MTEPDQIAYDLRHAAEKVDVSERTLLRDYKAGRIGFVRRPGSPKYYILHDELLRYAKSWEPAIPGR